VHKSFYDIYRNTLLEEKEELITLQKKESSKSNPVSQDQVSGEDKPVRGLLKKRQKSWRVLRAAFTFPLLGKYFKDFSPLRRISVLGDWERLVKRLAPVPGAGAMGGQKPPGGVGHPEKAEYKYPTQNCTDVQFC